MPQDLISQFDRKYALPIETYRQVQNITQRNAIPADIRWEGMMCYVISEGLSYVLTAGMENSDWVEFGALVDVTVVDNLLSTSSTDALSANQGRVLQTTKLSDAPSDGNTYGRLDGAWAVVGGGAVDSVFGRTGAVVAQTGDYTFAQIGSKPTTLAGYGITDAVPTSRTLTAGNGLTGGGDLSANRTFTLGTPGSTTLSSTNAVTASSHTHAFAPGGTTAQYLRGDGSLATFPDLGGYVPTSRTITAGTGLTGGGNLTANRSFALDTGYTDERYAKRVFTTKDSSSQDDNKWTKIATVNIDIRFQDVVNFVAYNQSNNSSGIPEGGFLLFKIKQQAAFGSDPEVGVESYNFDSTSVDIGYVIVQNTPTTIVEIYIKNIRKNNVIKGTVLSSANDSLVTWHTEDSYHTSVPGLVISSALKLWHSGNFTPSDYVPTSRTLTAGTGLTGGGNLTANRSFALDTGYTDGRYVQTSRTLTAGDGLTGGGSLAANRTFAVDGTVVRTSGTQSIGGAKTFTSNVIGSGTFTGTNFILSSDRRLKKNIEDYTPVHIPIRWREFTWKESGERQIGTIAQETPKQFVTKGADGKLAVKTVEMLMAKVAELEARIINLEI